MPKKPEPYPSDVSDEEWAFCAPYLTLRKEDAPQREPDLRAVFDAWRYLVRAGCPWRLMPHDLSPWRVVYEQTQRWNQAGRFEAMAHDLRVLLRVLAERALRPPATPLKRSTKIALAVIALVSLLETLAFSGTYLLVSRHYVSTDNAQVDGDQIAINAPSSGAVIDWSIGDGSTVRTNQIVGRIRAVGGGAQPQHVIRSPGPGTIAVSRYGQYDPSPTTLSRSRNTIAGTPLA